MLTEDYNKKFSAKTLKMPVNLYYEPWIVEHHYINIITEHQLIYDFHSKKCECSFIGVEIV